MYRMNSVAWPTPPRNRPQCTVINSAAAIRLLCLCQGWPNLLNIGAESRRLHGAGVSAQAFHAADFCYVNPVVKRGIDFFPQVAPKIQESHILPHCHNLDTPCPTI
jgi:hypothetical protein